MLKEYRRSTNIGIGLGVLILVFGRAMAGSPSLPVSLNVVISLSGAALYVWGCVQYAKGKGYSGYWGAFGFLWLPGLLVLAFLPDRHKASSGAQQGASAVPSRGSRDATELGIGRQGGEMENFVSGNTETTKIGFVNRNNQRCGGHRGTKGTDYNQFAYRMECLEPDCGHIYGANGTDVSQRKCPKCQTGKDGILF